MKTAQQALATVAQQINTPSSSARADVNPSHQRTTTQFSDRSEALAVDLFRVFQLRWPLQMQKAWGTLELMSAARGEYQLHWKGLSARQISEGIEKLRRAERRFMPEPVEFARDYCMTTAKELGIPSAPTAWQEACEHSHEIEHHQWSHWIVPKVASLTGWYRIRTGERLHDTRAAFEEHYATTVERVLNGTDVADELKHQALPDYQNIPQAEKQDRYASMLMQQQQQKMGIPKRMSHGDFMSRMRAAL